VSCVELIGAASSPGKRTVRLAFVWCARTRGRKRSQKSKSEIILLYRTRFGYLMRHSRRVSIRVWYKIIIYYITYVSLTETSNLYTLACTIPYYTPMFARNIYSAYNISSTRYLVPKSCVCRYNMRFWGGFPLHTCTCIYWPDPLAVNGLTNVSRRLDGLDRLGLVTY